MNLYRHAAALLALAGIALSQPVLAAPAVASPVAAQTPSTPFVDDPARVAVEQFLLRQASGLPGKVSVQVGTPSGGRAPECVDPQPFLPPGRSPPQRNPTLMRP